MEYLSIPLNQLELSMQNARGQPSMTDISDMIASIRTHGLMQGLVVVAGPAKKGNAPKSYKVIAGARRLAALKEMTRQGVPGYSSIPCVLVSDENAYELSLAENVVRRNMHPADEFAAFAILIDEKNTPAQIATRFGVTEKHVQGRLKLSKVHPDILKAYRNGDLSLEKVMAFTLSDDKKKQKEVFKNLTDWHEPDDIRESLTDNLVKADNVLVSFVTLEKYKKAGGAYTEDLFGEDVFLHDRPLLNKLARQKLHDYAAKVEQEGWGWVEIIPDGHIYDFTKGLTRIFEAPKKKDERRHLGVIVSVEKGMPVTTGWYLKKSDAEAFRKSSPKIAREAGLKPGKEKGVTSASVNDILRVQRHQVVQLVLSRGGEATIDLLLYTVARQLLGETSMASGYVSLPLAVDCQDAREYKEFSQSAAACGLQMVEKNLPLDWLKHKNEKERFEAFQVLSWGEKMHIIEYCTALMVEAEHPEEAKESLIEGLLARSGEKVCDYWRPTRENYLEHITRDQLLDIGLELFGLQWRKDFKNAKKPELVTELDGIFAHPDKYAGMGDDLQRRIFEWLPSGMGFSVSDADVKGQKHAQG
jgi:ParB family chromosome partitioning protein